jgi:hypothetical protein
MDETELYPDAIRSLILHVRQIRDDAIADREKRIEEEQKTVKGFLDVAEQRKKNKDSVKQVVIEDDDIRAIETEAAKLCRKQGIEILKATNGEV